MKILTNKQHLWLHIVNNPKAVNFLSPQKENFYDQHKKDCYS